MKKFVIWNQIKKIKVKNFKNYIISKIYKKLVLITEIENFHLERHSDFTKYFIDLGYKVDIILNKKQNESMEKFKPIKDVRIFELKKERKLKKNLKNLKTI